MQMPRLQMTTEMAKLGLQIERPTQRIEQPRANLEIEQPAAILEIRREDPKLTIDSTEAWASMNLKSVRRSIEEFAQAGRQGLLEGIARRAEEGDRLMRIEQGGEAIQEIAKQNATPPPAPINVRFLLGRFGVETSYEKGSVDIQVEQQAPRIHSQRQAPIHEYTPGKVTGVMEQYPQIHIDVQA